MTIGYGDLVPTVDLGRGLVFPYSVIGTVMLGLVIASFTRFLSDLGENKVVKHHAERKRIQILQKAGSTKFKASHEASPSYVNEPEKSRADHERNKPRGNWFRMKNSFYDLWNRIIPLVFIRERQTIRALNLHDQRERFREMRRIQESTSTFKRYTTLTISIITFIIVWAGGAVVFWQAEKSVQDMTYFRALYFCYVSLLTIGYGDLAPKSTAGRPFFVVWSLVAVPIMTILISSMSDTVIMNFKDATFYIGDLLVLPTKAAWAKWLQKSRWLIKKMTPSRKQWRDKAVQRWRIENSQQAQGDEMDISNQENGSYEDKDCRSITSRLRFHEESNVAFRLATAIQQVASQVKSRKDVKYNYEEWTEFIFLFNFTSSLEKGDTPEGQNGDICQLNWDWIGESSPLLSNQSEAEFVLDRLLESLLKYSRILGNQHKVHRARSSGRGAGAFSLHNRHRVSFGEDNSVSGNARNSG